ncbi:MAG: MFS transporter [Pseudonocardia sp.]|uniref:MFS transporter n=1 Tax=unclassified Pseudonocardia TaxID=2619320 RepID=UPI00086D3ED8|nr:MULTISPECIES: MFS transporter [unclassified Pseudonocardia]MBN9108318.1 MFS transporter [Pseudonocardia sp.]ODU30304.1 MAG: MFS transporter permease [Pseudonocardia sp. SCN 72-51]ODV08700.1 MAG: MFS transporter permease [Pseudonocardia sp. SCN 73-27]
MTATIVDGRPGRAAVGRFMAPLLLGASLNPINSSIIATALVAIGRDFSVGPAVTASLVAALYLASAIGQPAFGTLADRLGPRRVFLAGLVLVAAGGVLGTFATSIPALVVARVLLGLGTSAGYPTAVLAIRRWSTTHPGAPDGGMLGSLAIAGQVTATIGLPLGGLLVALTDWRVTFLVNVPLAVVTAVATMLWVPRDQSGSAADGRRALRSVLAELDPGGLLLFGGVMATLLFFLDDLQRPSWLLGAAFVVLAVALIVWELRIRRPFLDIRMLLRNRALTATYLRVGATFLVSYCVLYGLTQWLEQSRGLSSGEAGLVMLPMSVLAIVVSVPFSRRRMVRGALVLTAAAAVVGAAGILLFDAASPVWLLTIVIAVFGVLSGLGMIGNQAMLYQQAPYEQLGVAAGLMRTFMYSGAILSSSLIAVSFDGRASDGGLHAVAVALLLIGVLLAVATAVGLLWRRTPAPRSPRSEQVL